MITGHLPDSGGVACFDAPHHNPAQHALTTAAILRL